TGCCARTCAVRSACRAGAAPPLDTTPYPLPPGDGLYHVHRAPGEHCGRPGSDPHATLQRAYPALVVLCFLLASMKPSSQNIHFGANLLNFVVDFANSDLGSCHSGPPPSSSL